MRRAARNSVSPFREGFDARMAGKSVLACPYKWPENSALTDSERAEWLAGYNAAEAQLKKQEGAK